MRIEKEVLGEIRGNEVVSYNLINPTGIEVRVLNYGGIITDIIMPDKNGKRENIVLKYKNLQSYSTNPSYLGALIGRTSGRICNGEVELNGKIIKFNKNYNLHQGHGGNEGFDKKIYHVETNVKESSCEIELSRISIDGEEYYPGNLSVKVKYILNDEDELKIQYFGKSDKDTLVNLTNHSYFNLSGNGKETILNHNMLVNSNSIVELNHVQAATGRLLEVSNTEFDFGNMKKIGDDINGSHQQLIYGKGYDIPWYLNKDNNEVALTIYHEESGRTLDVVTDRKTIVLYTHNYPDDQLLDNGMSNVGRLGIAIEAQNPPIGVEGCFIEDSKLCAQEEYKTETIYKLYIS